jgi:hypothetical protein
MPYRKQVMSDSQRTIPEYLMAIEQLLSDKEKLEAEVERLEHSANIHINEYREEKARGDALKAEVERLRLWKVQAIELCPALNLVPQPTGDGGYK